MPFRIWLSLSAMRISSSSSGLSSTSRIIFSVISVFSKRKVESCAFVQGGLRPDAPAVAVDDALHGRQAYAGAGKLVHRVQALERAEEFFAVGHVESDPIVAHKESFPLN